MSNRLVLLAGLVAGAAPAAGAPAAAPANGGSAELSFQIGPPPAWVDLVELPAHGKPPAGSPASHTLLSDMQIRFAGPQTQHFYRRAEQVVSTAGIDEAATIRAQFEPSFETLTLHWVRVHRGVMVREALDRREVRLAHVEDDLYARIYHGEASALFFVPDVRVGDVVEYAYTTTGHNPVYEGRVFGAFTVAREFPVSRLRTRLLVPSGRTLRIRGRGTTADMITRGAGSHTEYLHDTRNVPAVIADSQAPSWYPTVPYLEYADFAGWSDVVAWAEPLYRVIPAAARAVAPVVDQLGAASSDPAERLRAATRFVQDEVRYLGIEVGPGSHRPRPPDQVLAQRFGDCKDKALLLVTLLRGLDIEADVALVHSYGGPGLPEVLPDPGAFNHVIVRATVNGQERWLDATSTMARGRDFTPPPYRWALPIRPDTGDALRAIPSAPLERPTIEVDEEWWVPEEADGVARFEVTSRHRGADADDMRQRMASETLEEIGRGYLNFYAGTFPGIDAAGAMTAQDDPDANEVVLHETYRVPGFWVDGERWFGAVEVTGILHKPGQTIRTAPLWLGNPRWVKQTITLQLPAGFDRHDSDDSVHTAHFDYTLKVRAIDAGVVLVHDVQTRGEPVPAGEVADYSRAVDQVNDKAGYQLTLGDGISWGGGASTRETLAGAIFLGAVMVVALLLLWRTNRKRV